MGIEEALCPYIPFLDADNYYLSGRFERAMSILYWEPAVDGVNAAVGTHFDTEDMQTWGEDERGRRRFTTMSEAVAPGELLATLCGEGRAKGWIHTPGITVRRTLFDRTGLLVTELRMAEDTALWWKMAAVVRLVAGRLEKPVAVRRLHGNNSISRNWGEVSQKYGLLARTHVYEWALKKELGPEILNPLLSLHLGGLRKFRVAGRRRQRLGLRDVPWLVKVGLRQPGLRRSVNYRKYIAESTYWTSVGSRLRRLFGRTT